MNVEYVLESTQKVVLEMTDAQGRTIKRMINKKQSAGSHTITINPQEYGVEPGTYFFRLITNNRMYTRQMVQVIYVV